MPIAVVKVVLWSMGVTWRSQVGANPNTHSNPTNLALISHKITLYRFNQGAHAIAGGSNGNRGCDTPLPPHFNHWPIRFGQLTLRTSEPSPVRIRSGCHSLQTLRWCSNLRELLMSETGWIINLWCGMRRSDLGQDRSQINKRKISQGQGLKFRP